MVSKKPEHRPARLPMEHVMAFNAVSANCYVGEAIAQRIDGSLDDEPDFDIIIFAKDKGRLIKACEYLGLKPDIEKSQPVAVAHRNSVRIANASQLQYNSLRPPATDEEL